MGQLLDSASRTPESLDKTLFQLRRCTLRHIFECVEVIDVQFPTSYKLIYQQFDKIFGLLVDDTQPLFNILHDKGMVQVYETLACIAIFCGDEFENKCAFIFRLFDFDCSGSIEQHELIKTMKIVIKGICKIVNIQYPQIQYIEKLAENCFMMIQKEVDGHIDYSEFQNWIYSQYDFQDFLLKFASTQSYPNAKRRMKEEMKQFEDFYETLVHQTLTIIEEAPEDAMAEDGESKNQESKDGGNEKNQNSGQSSEPKDLQKQEYLTESSPGKISNQIFFPVTGKSPKKGKRDPGVNYEIFQKKLEELLVKENHTPEIVEYMKNIIYETAKRHIQQQIQELKLKRILQMQDEKDNATFHHTHTQDLLTQQPQQSQSLPPVPQQSLLVTHQQSLQTVQSNHSGSKSHSSARPNLNVNVTQQISVELFSGEQASPTRFKANDPGSPTKSVFSIQTLTGLNEDELFFDIQIKKRDFMEIMKAWCAFSASDINNVDSLDVKELKVLLWIYEDEEPSNFQLNAEMKIIDEDKSFTIERIQWMKYLCEGDRNSADGGNFFKGGMRRIFQKYDKLKDGTVCVDDFQVMVKEIYREQFQLAQDKKTLQNIQKCIQKITAELIRDVTVHQLKFLTWSEFKLYIQRSLDKNKALAIYLDQIQA